jgi:hypothetical protein
MKLGYLQIIAVSDASRLEALEGDHPAMADMSMETAHRFRRSWTGSTPSNGSSIEARDSRVGCEGRVACEY